MFALVEHTNTCHPSTLSLLLASAPCPPPTCAAAIDTFECAGTFTRKTKKFSAAPELPVPAELQQQAAAAPAARATNKGAPRCCWLLRGQSFLSVGAEAYLELCRSPLFAV